MVGERPQSATGPARSRQLEPAIHRERTSGTKGTTRPKPREGWVEKPSTNTRSELLKQRQEVAHAEIKMNQNYRSSTGPPAASPGNHHPSTRRGRTREDMLRQRRSEHAGGPGGSASNQGDSGEDVAQRWSTKRWTDVVIDFREPRGNPEDLLDENGKERRFNPQEHKPLFSSFSPDGIFDPERRHAKPAGLARHKIDRSPSVVAKKAELAARRRAKQQARSAGSTDRRQAYARHMPEKKSNNRRVNQHIPSPSSGSRDDIIEAVPGESMSHTDNSQTSHTSRTSRTSRTSDEEWGGRGRIRTGGFGKNGW